MKRRTMVLLFLSGLLAVSTTIRAEAPAAPVRTVDDVLKNARIRDRVFVQGTIKRAFDFDTYLVSDESAEVAVSFLGVRQNLKVNDAVLVFGRFRGRSAHLTRYGLIEAIAWSPPQTPAAAALVEKYGIAAAPIREAAPPSETATQAPATTHSIESRLRELDDLKAKGLISADEYQEQRKRILGQL